MANKVSIIYDRACPACHIYCELARKAEPDSTILLNARDEPDLMDKITRCGLDIDEGMVVEVDGELYYGADAIHFLANLREGRGWFDRKWIASAP